MRPPRWILCDRWMVTKGATYGEDVRLILTAADGDGAYLVLSPMAADEIARHLEIAAGAVRGNLKKGATK